MKPLPCFQLLTCMMGLYLGWVPCLAATDWPQWRGPDRSNASQETGLLQEWPADGPPLRWQASGLGLGISPVSVAEGRVYTVGNRDGAEFAYALDAATGTKIWATRLGAAVAENPLMRWLTQRSPTVDGERIYTLTAKGELFCLRAADGQKLWQKSYATDYPTKRPWGYCDYPLVDGDQLICTPFSTKGVIVAFNKCDGKALWTTPGGSEGPAGYGATVVSMAGGIRHYVYLFRNGLMGVAAEDGRVLWEHPRADLRFGGSYTPVVHGSRIFSPNGYGGGMALFNLTPCGDELMVEEEYHKPFKFDAFHDSTALVGDHVYAFAAGGKPACIELRTGKVVWEKETAYGTNRGALTYAGDRLYLRHLNGIVALAEVSPAGCTEKGTFRIPHHETSMGVTFPVVAAGRLWLRDNDRLFCYDIRAGVPGGEPALPQNVLLTLTAKELDVEGSAAGSIRQGRDRAPDAIFIPTPDDVVERMLGMADVKPQDVVYDLGSGDGRIVIAAGKKHGARAVGYEIDPRLVELSRKKVAEQQLEGLVTIEHEDVFTVDLSKADVITVFLYPGLMERLKPQLQKLKPGTRIVSHQFVFPGVPANQSITVESKEDNEPHRLFLWTAPLPTGKPALQEDPQ
ncbi:MAG: PQQ-binding-like beta-propeller repeat protein [Verrucomicrobiota bacterium]